MADLQVTASLDSTLVSKGLLNMKQQMKATADGAVNEFKRIERAQKKLEQSTSSSRGGGGVRGGFAGGRNMSYMAGQAAMQAQDVAVQLQMGAKATTVIAQQGSQLLSLFGPGGMLLGGAVAVGAALWSWKSGMDGTVKSAQEFNEKIKEIRAETAAALSESIAGNADKLEVLKAQPSDRSVTEENQRYRNEIAAIEERAYVDKAQKTEALNLAKQVHQENLKDANEADAKTYANFTASLAKKHEKANKANAEQVERDKKAKQDSIDEQTRIDEDYINRRVQRELDRDAARNALTKGAAETMRDIKEKEADANKDAIEKGALEFKELKGRTQGKTQADVRRALREDERARKEDEKWAKKMDATAGGLVDIKRGMDGKILSGRDPVTGKRVSKDEAQKRLEALRKADAAKGNEKVDFSEASMAELAKQITIILTR